MFQDSSTGPRPVCLILIEGFCPKFHWIWNSGSGGDFYFKLCRPFCSVMGKSLWNFETILSPPVLFLLTIQSSTSFVDLGLSWHIVEPVSCSFVVTWWERDDLLPLQCVMFSCFYHFPIRCLGSGVVLNCIDSWSLHSSSLWQRALLGTFCEFISISLELFWIFIFLISSTS